MSNDSESDSVSDKLTSAAAAALAKQALGQVSKAAGGVLTDLEATLADKQRANSSAGDTLLPAAVDVDEDLFASKQDNASSTDAADDAHDEQEAALRLQQAREALAKMKAELSGAVAAAEPLEADPTPDETIPFVDDVSPDAVTETGAPPRVATSFRPDPLDAAEEALAMAARARGVPLQLPSRTAPDRTDPFGAATRALEAARLARGGAPRDASPPSPTTTSSRVRDPFKAAEAALEAAAAARAEVGVSPEQDQREAAARSELARLRRVKPTTDSDSDDSASTPKKRDL